MTSTYRDNPAFRGDIADLLIDGEDDKSKENDSHCVGKSNLPSEPFDDDFYLDDSMMALNTSIDYDAMDTSTLNLGRLISEGRNTGPGSLGDEEIVSSLKIACLEACQDHKTDQNCIQTFQIIIGEATSAEDRKTRANESLINYFANLGKKDTGIMDYDFVLSLLKIADVNSTDIYGQSIMHEVAREWSTDIAMLLLSKGMDIDIEDRWGRTPLFVAVAANHEEMIDWLIEHGADINHKTIEGDGQCPIHYAAKYNAVIAFEVLMKKGANPLIRDDRNRTPFYLAAEAGHGKICEFMLEIDLPTASYSDSGESTIDHIIERLPTGLASKALDQFLSPSNIAGKTKVFLSCLGKRRWKLISQYNSKPVACNVDPPTPLDIVLLYEHHELIKHPAVLLLLEAKWKYFGAKYVYLNVFLHLLFTAMWTCAVTIFKEDDNWYDEFGMLALTMLSQVLTFFFIYKLYLLACLEYSSQAEEKKRLRQQCYRSEKYLHPRWPMDEMMFKKKLEIINTIKPKFFKDGWNLVEIVCLLMATGQSILTTVYVAFCKSQCKVNTAAWENMTVLRNVRKYYSVVFVIILWLRLNICLRYHQSFGPFIAMLGGCLYALAQIGFLFFEFFIPFNVACWVLFGGKIKENSGSDSEFEEFHNMVYQLYLLAFVGDYEYSTLRSIDAITSQVFVGLYALVVSIITINLYIALLSEAYARISARAEATAYIQEAMQLSQIEKLFPELKHEFEVHVNKHFSPLIIDEVLEKEETSSARTIIKEASINVIKLSDSMKKIIQEQSIMRKDLANLDAVFRKFQEQFDVDKTRLIRRQFTDVMQHEERILTKFTKRTDYRFSKLMKKLKDITTIHNS